MTKEHTKKKNRDAAEAETAAERAAETGPEKVEKGPGKLYICATPIGNLGDMTPRVVEALKSVDFIAAEDTRNSIRLLNHFEIRTPMTSYHEYNRFDKADELVRQILGGKNVAFVGTSHQALCVRGLPAPGKEQKGTTGGAGSSAERDQDHGAVRSAPSP